MMLRAVNCWVAFGWTFVFDGVTPIAVSVWLTVTPTLLVTVAPLRSRIGAWRV